MKSDLSIEIQPASYMYKKSAAGTLRLPKTITVYKLLVFSLFLDSYALFFIGTFPVQLYHFVFAIIIVLSMLKATIRKLKITTSSVYIFSFLVWIFVSLFLTSAGNYDGVFLLALMCMAALFSSHAIDSNDFDSIIDFFSHNMNILAIYGVLQIALRFHNFHVREFYPGDLIIKNHMVEGFNWTN